MNIQKVCIWFGAFFISTSIGGILFNNILFFPYTILHSAGSFGIGLALFASGISRKKNSAQNAALDIGIILVLLGCGGFFLGTNGAPFVIIPKALELQIYHHIMNLILGVLLLVVFYIDKKRDDAFSRLTVYLQTRKVR